jgi:hypothetical protein
MTTAYFNIARRNHEWVILGILHLPDTAALERLERETPKGPKIRPCAWGIQKSLTTL